MRAILACLLVALASGGVPARAQESPPPAVEALAGPVRPGDVVRVAVDGAPRYSGDFRVEADGAVAIPRLGRVGVGGLQPGPAADAVAARILMLQLLKRPDVVVSIVARRAREAFVGGAVARPGRVALRDDARLSDLLEGAGPAPGADLARVKLLRGGTERGIDYRAWRAGRADDASVNPPLEDGDRVYVFASDQPEGIARVVGEVKDPARSVVALTEGATVGRALQQAGGLTDLADVAKVVVRRGAETIPVDVEAVLRGDRSADLMLRDRDEIVVPRRVRRAQFSVTGAVRSAGSYPLTGRTTILDAVSQAGGVLDGAKRGEALLRHTGETGRVTTTRIDLARDAAAAIVLSDGDVVEIPYGGRRPIFDANQTVGLLVGIASLLNFFKR